MQTEVLLDSVFGTHDESVTDTRRINLRTNGEKYSPRIQCSSLSSISSPYSGFVTDADIVQGLLLTMVFYYVKLGE